MQECAKVWEYSNVSACWSTTCLYIFIILLSWPEGKDVLA